MMDKNRDGFIDKNELKEMLTSLGKFNTTGLFIMSLSDLLI